MPSTADQWTEIQLSGHRCDVFEPTRPCEHSYVVIYLHGVHLGRLIENETYTRLFDQHGLRVIAPLTKRSFWTDRICREFDPRLTAERYLIDHVLPHITEHWQTRPPAIALLGTSMGGQGALRLSFKYPNLFPIAAALAPALDFQLVYDDPEGETLREMYPDAEAARQDTATLHVHPLNWPRNIYFACDPDDWPWIESAQRLQMKLGALGIPHDCDLTTSGGGHGFTYYNGMAPAVIDFMIRRLEQERRRVV